MVQPFVCGITSQCVDESTEECSRNSSLPRILDRTASSSIEPDLLVVRKARVAHVQQFYQDCGNKAAPELNKASELCEDEVLYIHNELFHAFDEHVEASIQDLSIFSLLSQNLSYHRRRRTPLALIEAGRTYGQLWGMTMLTSFLMIIAPLLVWRTTRRFVRCAHDAQREQVIIAMCLFVYLSWEMVSPLVEARLLLYFSVIESHPVPSKILVFGAILKIASVGITLLATGDLFLANPGIVDQILNALALTFLTNLDLSMSRAILASNVHAVAVHRAQTNLRKLAQDAVHDSNPAYGHFALSRLLSFREQWRRLPRHSPLVLLAEAGYYSYWLLAVAVGFRIASCISEEGNM